MITKMNFLRVIALAIALLLMANCQAEIKQSNSTNVPLESIIIIPIPDQVPDATEIEVMWQQLRKICETYDSQSDDHVFNSNCRHKAEEICNWQGDINNLDRFTLERIENIKESTCALLSLNY